jgi:antitoxin (DNA-binding transcriptional repressor) of toxin-antitoxin stability system
MAAIPTEEELIAEFAEALHRMLTQHERTVARLLARRKPRQARLMFPFSLLDQLIGSGLRGLDRAVGRLVKRLIR